MNHLTEAEKAHKKELMQKIQQEYKEEPIQNCVTDQQLKNFGEALKLKGFNFDPFKVIKEIDAEAERQFKKMFADHFTGVKVDRLADIKNEIIAWYNAEEERFAKFRDNYLATAQGPAHMDVGAPPVFDHGDAHAELPVSEPPAPMAEVTPISKAKKKPGKKK